MKIVQLVTQMEAGGAQRVAILLGEALRDQGYSVEIWFLYLKRPAYANLPGVRVLLERPPSGLDYLRIIFKLQKLLQSSKPDVLITHTHYANVIGQFVARFSPPSKRIAVQHNPVHTYPKIAKWADLVLGTTGFYSANVAVSQVVVDSLVRYPSRYKNKLIKIYNGIPNLQLDNSVQKFRADWNLPEKTPLLINVGRLARQKNQATLIEALLNIPDANLLLIGEGELRHHLIEKVMALGLEKRVHFLGELKSQDVLALLSISDVFVFPSLYEAMPMALVEAMSLGLPIVAGDIPAMREVLGDAGILIPPEKAISIASSVCQILNSPELALRLRESSRQRASLFSGQKMVESYAKLFY